MKNFKILLFAFFASVLFITNSCDRKADEESNNSLAIGKCDISSKIDGNGINHDFQSDIAISVAGCSSGCLLHGIKMLNASSFRGFHITLTSNIPPGKYTAKQLFENYSETSVSYIHDSNDMESTYVMDYDSDLPTNLILTINTNSGGLIEGSFSGTLININNKKITLNGQFKARP